MSAHSEIFKKLVIADDDQDDQQMMKEIIEEYSSFIKTTCITDGKKLMDHLSGGELPDLLLLDLNMPFKTGLQCLNEIRQNKKLKHIPVVILSTSRNKQDIETCFMSGAELFYSKPWSLGAYKALLHSILEIDWRSFKRPESKEEFAKIAMEAATRD